MLKPFYFDYYNADLFKKTAQEIADELGVSDYWNKWTTTTKEKHEKIFCKNSKDGKGYFFEIDIPGFEQKEIAVEVSKEYNSIYIAANNSNRTFAKTVNLPSNTDCDTVSSSLKNGVLTVSADFIKKEEPKQKIRKIEVQQG